LVGRGITGEVKLEYVIDYTAWADIGSGDRQHRPGVPNVVY